MLRQRKRARGILDASVVEHAQKVLDEECKAYFDKLGPLKAFVPKLVKVKQGQRIVLYNDTDSALSKEMYTQHTKSV